jgi:hypothetical protein
MAIAEHSMCQPGRPGPIGVSQKCSPGFGAFHKANRAHFFHSDVIAARAGPKSRQVNLSKASVVWKFAMR